MTVLPRPHFSSDHRMAVTLYYMPEQRVEGDIDNIVKFVLDAMSKHIYLDDAQVERLVVQKFEPGNVFDFSNPSAGIVTALASPNRLLKKEVGFIRRRLS